MPASGAYRFQADRKAACRIRWLIYRRFGRIQLDWLIVYASYRLRRGRKSSVFALYGLRLKSEHSSYMTLGQIRVDFTSSLFPRVPLQLFPPRIAPAARCACDAAGPGKLSAIIDADTPLAPFVVGQVTHFLLPLQRVNFMLHPRSCACDELRGTGRIGFNDEGR